MRVTGYQRVRSAARVRRRREERVQEAFDEYLDYIVERLGTLGVESSVAIDVVFNTVEHLGEQGELPPFPEGDVSYQVMGRWLVAAVDFGLAEFVEGVVAE